MANQQISLDYYPGLKTFFFSSSSALSVEPFCSCSVYSHAGRLELGAASPGGTTPGSPAEGPRRAPV